MIIILSQTIDNNYLYITLYIFIFILLYISVNIMDTGITDCRMENMESLNDSSHYHLCKQCNVNTTDIDNKHRYIKILDRRLPIPTM